MSLGRVAVILAGGAGERFWPMSRKDRPKQLLRLTHPDETLLEQSIRRIQPLVDPGMVFVSTQSGLRESVEGAVGLDAGHVWGEPVGRNTLGALIWAAAHLIKEHPGAWRDLTMAVLAADHRIGEVEAFRSALSIAMDVAEREDVLATVGIAPTRAETGYGYIEFDASATIAPNTYRCVRFHEKPCPEDAQRYAASGRHLWNSGMFFWRLGAFVDALERAQPECHRVALALSQLTRLEDGDEARRLFDVLPSISVDHGLLESADNVVVTVGSFPWDDVGAWDALSRTMQPDGDGNIAVGRVLAVDSENCVLVNEHAEVQVGVLGLKDFVVVVSGNAVLVCPKSEAQRVRKIVTALEDA